MFTYEQQDKINFCQFEYKCEYAGILWRSITLTVVARAVLGIIELMNISIKQIEIDFIDSQTWGSLIAEAFYRRLNAKYIVEAPELVWRQSFLSFPKLVLLPSRHSIC